MESVWVPPKKGRKGSRAVAPKPLASGERESRADESARPISARGLARLSLLGLIAVVVIINLPFITRHYMLGYDGKLALGVFDYMYSGWLFSGALPQWMVYGLHGLDAAPFHLSFLSASSYWLFLVGKVLGITDSLTLFALTLCCEQLLFLLGFHLLSGRLFQEPLTRFCVCLTAVGLASWQSQPFFNLRLFCLLPLAFYLLLRVRHDQAGYCGWLAGVVAILGPQGSSYAYVLWAFLLTVFSLGLFWGRFGLLRVLFQPRGLNLLTAVLFVCLALAFSGTLWHALDNCLCGSPGRDGDGKVSLGVFLTYGGTSLPQILSSLLLPSAFMVDVEGRAGMSDYVGLISLFCLPLAARNWRQFPNAWPFALICGVVMAMSLGGLFASVIYFLPGMHLFRHLGFLTGVLRVLILILSGFGCDVLIGLVRERKLLPRPIGVKLLGLGLVLLLYVDLNIGGAAWAVVCEDLQRNAGQFLDALQGSALYPIAPGSPGIRVRPGRRMPLPTNLVTRPQQAGPQPGAVGDLRGGGLRALPTRTARPSLRTQRSNRLSGRTPSLALRAPATGGESGFDPFPTTAFGWEADL